MLKTSFEEIVNIASIGKEENPIHMNDILKLAHDENISPALNDKEKVLLIAIDIQQDFLDNGALGVPGSIKDVGRLVQWIYKNFEKITQITASIDTHNPFQIFHPCWWVDKKGNTPPVFTAITLKDIDDGKWLPAINPEGSREYVENLEKSGKKTLVVWPYHCLQGTSGNSLENQFANILYYHSVARNVVVDRMVKGFDPISEMYGIVKPEFDPKNSVNMDFLNKLSEFDKIIIAGEAKSHCVLESIKQILEHYKDNLELTKKVFILEDCMSNIPSFEKSTEDEFNKFKFKYKVNIVQTTNYDL